MHPRSFDLEVQGTKIRLETLVRETGKDLLVCLHGLGCSRQTFRDIWSRSEFATCSILCPDLPGSGGSSAPLDFSYAMEDQALVCETLVSRYPDHRIHLVGHSMGGAIGLLLPRVASDRIVTFANVEGNLNPEDCMFGSRQVAGSSFESFQTDLMPKFKQSSESWMLNGLDSASELAFYRSALSLVKWSDSGQLLKSFLELPCEKAYIYGEQNAGHPTVASVEGINRVQISNSGHFVMNDNPDEFYACLAEFIGIGDG